MNNKYYLFYSEREEISRLCLKSSLNNNLIKRVCIEKK